MRFLGFKRKLDEAVAPYLPLIQEKYNEIIRSMGARSKEALGDEELMAQVFRRVHRRLPLPVRLTFREQPFVAFCLRNRRRIHGGIGPDQPGRADGGDAGDR